MLSCGKVIGRLPKLTRHSQVNHFYQPLKYVGIINVSNLWYSNNASNKKQYKPVGTTIKPEECIPNTTCPTSCYEICGKPDPSKSGGSGKDGGIPLYWKLLAALILTGVTIYAVSQSDWYDSKKSDSPTDVSKKKEPRRRRRSNHKIKVPPNSSLIPQEVPYLLIGGGTAAFSAFRSIKSRDPKAKVLVITEEEDFPYMRPPLSKELWYNTDRITTAQLNFKQWNGSPRSIFYEPSEFYSNVQGLTDSEKGGVAVATGWKVTKIDVPNKTVILDDDYEIKYDKCLVATGASPKNLPIFENAREDLRSKIMTFRTKEDFLDLEDKAFDPNCKNIVIIGGGFLGSELACSLARNLDKTNKKVFQIYKEKFIMGQVLPEYLSEWATKKATMEGVACIPNSEVEDYTFKNGKLSLILSGDKTLDADQVIVAVGAKPNTNIAEISHLETHPEVGGFLVNAELEARSNLWVAGDAACFYDIMLGRRRVEHHDHAVVSGRLAGENMTGARKPYLHQSMFWSDLGPEVSYEAIGIVDSSLPTVGVFAKSSPGDTPNEGGQSSGAKDNSSPNSSDSAQSEVRKPELASHVRDQYDYNKNSADSKKYDDFGKGVIFYLRDDIVVGIVLWNIFSRMSIARQVLARGTKYDDLNEVAKLFTIHDN